MRNEHHPLKVVWKPCTRRAPASFFVALLSSVDIFILDYPEHWRISQEFTSYRICEFPCAGQYVSCTKGRKL